MNKSYIFLLLLSFSLSAYSQNKPKFLYAEISDKSVSLTPFYKVFGSSFDPALTLGGGIDYFQKGNSTIFQPAQLTFYSTKMIGRGITFSTSIGYRYMLKSGIFAELMLGVGASGFIPSVETFSLDENQQYVSTRPVHLIVGAPLDILAGYNFRSFGIYLKYRYMVEGKYTDILPVIPTSLIGLGIRYHLNIKSE